MAHVAKVIFKRYSDAHCSIIAKFDDRFYQFDILPSYMKEHNITYKTYDEFTREVEEAIKQGKGWIDYYDHSSLTYALSPNSEDSCSMKFVCPRIKEATCETPANTKTKVVAKERDPKVTIEEDGSRYDIRIDYADGRTYRGNLCPMLGSPFKRDGSRCVTGRHTDEILDVDSRIANGRYELINTYHGTLMCEFLSWGRGYHPYVECARVDQPQTLPPKGAFLHYTVSGLDIDLSHGSCTTYTEVASFGSAMFWGEKLASQGDTRGLAILASIYDKSGEYGNAIDVLLRGIRMEGENGKNCACHTHMRDELFKYAPYIHSCERQPLADADSAPQIFDDRIEWHNKEGKLHRDCDLPAVVYADGTLKWCQNGQVHRVTNDTGGTKPAIKRPDGTREWWQHGVPCRTDKGSGDGLVLPTIVHSDDSWYWFDDGQLHRSEKGPDGMTLPAVMRGRNFRQWYNRGKLHRDEKDSNGNSLPAVIHDDSRCEYWIDGIRFK